MSRFAFAFSLVALGCTNAPPDIGANEAPIVNGTLGGPDAVVVIQNLAESALCSGTLISPRVVLTAKHCVQQPGASIMGPVLPSQMIVGVGSSVNAVTAVLHVQAIHTTPGAWTETAGGGLTGDLIGKDIALLVLASGPSGVTPIPVRRTDPSTLAGQRITAVGYGETPAGIVGTKYMTTGIVQRVSGGLIQVGSLTCQGDSGGPAITSDNEVAGTVSFGSGGCGGGYGAYNEIYPYLDMVDAAITESGMCLNNGAEVCDGADNNCDGQIDEGCVAIGGRCMMSSQCVGQNCQQTSAGMLCTMACDPFHPQTGCGPGFYCSMTMGTCTGWCVPATGTPGTLGNDQTCAHDVECASLFCRDPGDGRQRCLSPCQGDTGMCLAGEACAANPGTCGGCVAQDVVVGTRGLGEECSADTGCYSGHCLADDGRSYCSRSCSVDSDCGNRGFHCRDSFCVSGPRGQLGDACAENTDCTDMYFCAARGMEHWCTRLCLDGMCDDGFQCVAAGGTMICAPTNGILGDACMTSDNCVSGVCAQADGAGVCTRNCGADAPCGPGFECRRTSDGVSAVCTRVQVAPPSGGGGCATAAGQGEGRASWLALLAIGMLVVSRRRRGAR